MTTRRRGDDERRPIALLVAIFVAALLAGVAMGWFVRRWTHPTLEDRTRDAVQDMSNAAHKLTR